MQNLIGHSIGRYHILEQLGEGGMAVVYKAYDTHLECEVAVKVIRTENLPQSGVERALKRFEREAKAVAKLNHPNIVKVTDYGETDDKPYLVMPYLPGGTLKELIKQRGRIPWQEAVRTLAPITEALGYAHEHHVIHRDIKPSNILLTDKGIPMLTDFGVAKIIEEEATQDLTGTAATIGTPEYMAPEQITSKNVDGRADIYSLGIVLYEMITGRRPFEADTPMAVLFKHASDPLPRPSQYVKDLPPNIENLLIKSLAKKPEDRYQSAEEFRNAISNLDSKQDKESRQTAPEKKVLKPTLRNLLFGAGVLVLLAAGILIGNLISRDKPAASVPSATSTIAPTMTVTLTPTNTTQPTLTATSTPEVTATATTDPNAVMGEITTNVKCRKGPSEYLYAFDEMVEPQTVSILGQSMNGTWIQFKPENSSSICWTIKNYITTSASLAELPYIPDPEVTGTIYYGVEFAYCEGAGWSGNTCTFKPSCYRYFFDYHIMYFLSEKDIRNYYLFTMYGYEHKIIKFFTFTTEAKGNFPDKETISCPIKGNSNNYELIK